MNKYFKNVKLFYDRYQKIVRIIISIALITILVSKTDIKTSLSLLREINLLILIPLFGYIPALVISTIKWKHALKTKINFYELLKTYWIANFFSNFLPSTIGGDSYKVLRLKKKLGIKRVVNSIVFDRFSGFISLIILAVLFSAPLYNLTHNPYLLSIPILLLAGFIVIFYLCDNIYFKITYIETIKKYFLQFKSQIVFLVSISFLFNLLGAFGLWVYFFMFDYNINFLTIIGFYSTIQIISTIPLSINAIGIREGIMIYLFSSINCPLEVTLNVALLSRLIMLIQTSTGGLIFLANKKEH